MTATSRWWTAPAYAALEDPISLEPIRALGVLDEGHDDVHEPHAVKSLL